MANQTAPKPELHEILDAQTGLIADVVLISPAGKQSSRVQVPWSSLTDVEKKSLAKSIKREIAKA